MWLLLQRFNMIGIVLLPNVLVAKPQELTSHSKWQNVGDGRKGEVKRYLVSVTGKMIIPLTEVET